jgi:hypothetical protein
MTRDEYVASIKSAFVLLGTKAVKTQLVALTGFFGLPLISGFVDWVLAKVLTIVATQAEIQVFFFFIDMRVADQGRDFEEAALNYWRIQQNGNKEAQKEAENELLKKFVPLIKLAS